MSENEKLLPCPFCGTENVSMSFSATLMSADPAARFVECEECAACGPSCDIIDGDDDDAKRRAIAAWKTRAALSTPPSKADADDVERIKHMVDRFLMWRLPPDFAPDGGVIFSHTSGGRVNEPIGTNLLTAVQAEAMVRFMVEGLPAIQNRDAGLRDHTSQFIADVEAELRRARDKFPGDRIMTIALAEEFGELAKAMLDEDGRAVWKEAVQTAVMAARVAIDGDGSVDEWRAEKGLGEHRCGGDAPQYCDHCGATRKTRSPYCAPPFDQKPHEWTGKHPADQRRAALQMGGEKP